MQHHRRPVVLVPMSISATGCSTTGSSEAAMLAGMALKWRWRERMRAAGKPTDRPNLVMGANVQVCWEKFCRYWDVEPRLVPMEGERYHLGAERGGRAVRREHDRRGRDPRLDLRRQLRAGRGDRRGARRARERQGPRRPAARRRRLGRLRRAVHPARARVGLPDPAGAVDQRLRPQVRARLPRRRLGGLARRGGAAQGPRLRRQLPRRPHADVRAELLAARQRGRRAVLHVRQPRARGLPPGHPGHPGRRDVPRRPGSPRSAPTG